MNDQVTHRLYRHFQELPLGMRALFTATLLVLGLGYAFASLYVFAAHAGADGRPGLSIQDIVITYSGSTDTTPLELALRSSMSGMLPQRDLAAVLEWVHAGADRRAFEAGIDSILATNCISCHDGSNPHLSNLAGFDNVQLVVAQDTGADLYKLVRASHIHLFGITFIFFIVGFIFSHAYVRPVWLKIVIIVLPFAGLTADVLGWYATKYIPAFAWVVLIAGTINGLSFATMWAISLYQMWIYKLPAHVRERHRGDLDERR